MRTALLDATRRISDGRFRAQLTLGGRSILAWQVDLARSLGCERIICLCDQHIDEILTIQREVERDGGSFHAVRSNLQLASLVHSDDELVVLRDGLIADRDTTMQLAGVDNAKAPNQLPKLIATIPAAHALGEENPDDFERIDRDQHWAGFAIMRAAHLHQLADLPADGEPMSLLLRLGLQARLECVPVPQEVLGNRRWMLALGDSGLAQREKALIEERRGTVDANGLSAAIANWGVAAIAPKWLARGSEVSALILCIAVIGILTIGVWLSLGGEAASKPLLGVLVLALAASGAFAGATSKAWAALRSAIWPKSHAFIRAGSIDAIIDLTCIAALVIAHGLYPDPALRIALPLVAIGLARLAGASRIRAKANLWRDRTCQMLIFMLSAGIGLLSEFLALFTLGAVLQLMVRARKD